MIYKHFIILVDPSSRRDDNGAFISKLRLDMNACFVILSKAKNLHESGELPCSFGIL
jgi:hypothetical protein